MSLSAVEDAGIFQYLGYLEIQTVSRVLTRESPDGSLLKHAEHAAHDPGTGASGGCDGTQDLLNKEQQVGHVDVQVLPVCQPAGINFTWPTCLKDLRAERRERKLVS